MNTVRITGKTVSNDINDNLRWIFRNV